MVVDHYGDAADIPGITDQEPTGSCLSPLRQPSKKRRLVSDDSPPKNGDRPAFACPFWKFDHLAHTRCISRHLTSIHRVKEHLIRKHRPGLYCARCLQVFKDVDEEAKHVQLGEECSRNSERPFPFVTTEQWWLLRRKSKEAEAQEASWFRIYDVLFPGQPRPSSPYLDVVSIEGLAKFREYYALHGSRIVQDVLDQLHRDPDGQSIASVVPTSTVQDIIKTLIDESLTSLRSKILTGHLDGEPVLGSCRDSRWSGSTLGPADTYCSSDSSDFGGKGTCFKRNRVPIRRLTLTGVE